MRPLTFILLAMVTLPSYAQQLTTRDVDSIATVIADQLIASKRADEVLVFNSGCIGCVRVNNECSCGDGYTITYLMWKEQNKTWLTQLNCCAHEQSIELNDSTIWGELSLNKNRIFNSKFNEDYISSHYRYWHIKILPTFPTELRMYDYYFAKNYKYQKHNE